MTFAFQKEKSRIRREFRCSIPENRFQRRISGTFGINSTKVDKAHTREYGGNGIGLSIVKAIMESFHHEYGVNNYENGVEFWFELSAK